MQSWVRAAIALMSVSDILEAVHIKPASPVAEAYVRTQLIPNTIVVRILSWATTSTRIYKVNVVLFLSWATPSTLVLHMVVCKIVLGYALDPARTYSILTTV